MAAEAQLLRFARFTVEPVLAHHSILKPSVLARFQETLAAVDSGPAAAAAAAEAAIEARGSSDPTIGSEGTLAYLITFDTASASSGSTARARLRRRSGA